MTDRVKTYPWPKAEQHDVFEVLSFAEGTLMEGRVGIDLFHVASGQRSAIHAHEHSDTLVIALKGKGIVIIDDVEFPFVGSRDILWFDKGVYHGVVTAKIGLYALSVQIPGIKMRDKDGNVKVDLVPMQSK